jgi:hypothetical protein
VIKPQHITMCRLSLFRSRQIRGINITKIAVHIPFYITDFSGRKYPRHFFDHVFSDFRIAEVQNTLIPSLGMWMAGNLHGPVGMFFIEVTVFTDHLRLHPETEIHPQGFDFFTEGNNSSGQLLRIRFPVSQGGSIVIPPGKPPIIHDEQFDADICSRFCQL